VITEKGIAERVERLHQLSTGLAKEVALWKPGNDPLLHLERKAYLNAIQDALAGLEAARVVLSRVGHRLAEVRLVRPNHIIEGGGDHEAA
jgi:hypothetical protein